MSKELIITLQKKIYEIIILTVNNRNFPRSDILWATLNTCTIFNKYIDTKRGIHTYQSLKKNETFPTLNDWYRVLRVGTFSSESSFSKITCSQIRSVGEKMGVYGNDSAVWMEIKENF